LLAIGRVVQYANAVDIVEALLEKRQIQNAGLANPNVVSRTQVSRGDIGGQTQIDAYNVRAPAAGDVGKAAHPAPNVEHPLALQFSRTKAGGLDELPFRQI